MGEREIEREKKGERRGEIEREKGREKRGERERGGGGSIPDPFHSLSNQRSISRNPR